MNLKNVRNELQHILSGKSRTGHNILIQTVASYLRTGKRASPLAQEKHQNKSKEAEELLDFISQNQLFYDRIDTKKYLSQGAEQKVYVNFFNPFFCIKTTSPEILYRNSLQRHQLSWLAIAAKC